MVRYKLYNSLLVLLYLVEQPQILEWSSGFKKELFLHWCYRNLLLKRRLPRKCIDQRVRRAMVRELANR